MGAWAWFLGGGWILAAGGVVVLGLVAAAVVVGVTARKRDYAKRWARHVLGDFPQAPAVYGSMILAEERGLYWPAPIRYELAHEGDWYAQTAADLSPEALAQEVMPDENCTAPPEMQLRAVPSAHVNSGPGDTSLAPGPDPGQAIQLQAHSEPDLPTYDLGPLAAWVLDCHERRHREKWAYADHLVAVAA